MTFSTRFVAFARLAIVRAVNVAGANAPKSTAGARTARVATAARSIGAVSLAAVMLTTAAVRLDRRIVDTAEAGNAGSETTHGYAGDDATAGMSDGKSFRQTRGWMHYALKTFEDTPVTVACTFISTDNAARNYDVVVEDSVVASRTFTPQSTNPAVVEISVPFSLTKGKASVAVIIRARGGPTPALQTIRTIQDHYEHH